MKLKEAVTVPELLKQIRQCQGDVEFRTQEGDCLNLKSELSKYLFAAICDNKYFMDSGNLYCQNSEDYQRLSAYFEM